MDDEEKRRMLVNVTIAAVIVLLLGVGSWLVDHLIRQSKLEDCLMAHRRDCRGVESPIPSR